MFARRVSSTSYLFATRSFYDTRSRNDTIFATATSINSNKGSPLGVVRISGKKTGFILKSILDQPAQIKPRYATLKKIIEPKSREPIDLGLVIWFPSPNSYTGEDVCELHLHGSQAIIAKMLSTLGSISGVRPAEPGEFTRRAVMNGKMSLMQAESLPDLIKSRTDNQRRLALNGLDGTTRQKYDQWTQQLINILAHLEASIDFGEDELIGEQAVIRDCIEKLHCLAKMIDSYIGSSSRCRDFVESGVSVAILGKPNAGKSTFMNLICGRDLSIVSSLGGTTRDLVRHSLEISGHSITLCDTAGLRNLTTITPPGLISERPSEQSSLEMHRSIEREGIRRALDVANKADIMIYLIDGSRIGNLNSAFDTIYNELSGALAAVFDTNTNGKLKSVHLVMNKLDLADKDQTKSLTSTMTHQLGEMMRKKLSEHHNISNLRFDISSISCKTEQNFDQFMRSLTSRLDEMCCSVQDNELNGHAEFDYVNERHLSLLRSMHRHLELASQMDFETVDKMAQHVRESVDYLSRIVGSISSDDVIDVIFRDFCIGK